jgi:CarD family transcriptional regulator
MAKAKTKLKSKAKAPTKSTSQSTAKSVTKPAAKKQVAKPPVNKKAKPVSATAKKRAVKKAVSAKSESTPATKRSAANPLAKSTATKPAARKTSKKLPFARGDYVVYPTHGVGKVTGVEKQEVAGFNLQLFVILFASEKMTLRVPVEKVVDSGLRKISSKDKMMSVIGTLKGRARSKRTMWSRRAQEYEAKINSGDPIAIAEVVRDLYRAPGQPEQSYSERQMYEAALDRLVNEFALVEKLDVEAATEKLETVLGG